MVILMMRRCLRLSSESPKNKLEKTKNGKRKNPGGDFWIFFFNNKTLNRFIAIFIYLFDLASIFKYKGKYFYKLSY